MASVSWDDPDVRFEHTWIVGPTGSGKTVLLKALIANDLRAVRQGRASIVVIEGEGQILNTLESLQVFDDIPLTIIDPRDEGLSLNPFAMGMSNRGAETSVIELLE